MLSSGDDKGDLGLYDNLQMRYILSNGLMYRTGHGRDKCNYDQCVLDAHDESAVGLCAEERFAIVSEIMNFN